MKFNKKRSFFGVLFALAFAFSFSFKASADTEVKGTVHNILEGQVKLSDTSDSTVNELKKIAQADPNVKVIISGNEISISQDMGASEDASLKVQGKNVAVKNGKFDTTVKNSRTSDIVVSDNGASTTIQNVKNDTHMNIVNKVDLGQMFEDMDKSNGDDTKYGSENTVVTNNTTLLSFIDDLITPRVEASAKRYTGQKIGQLVHKGAHVHCNRFNGPHSNHRYYSRLTGQGYVNYYGSDCYHEAAIYNCPYNKPDTKCDGLLKHGAHDCSKMKHWPVTAWFRNK